MAGLNPRGEREGELRERLVLQRDRIEKRIRKCQTSVLTRSEEDAEKLEAAMVAEVEKRRAKVGTLLYWTQFWHWWGLSSGLRPQSVYVYSRR